MIRLLVDQNFNGHILDGLPTIGERFHPETSVAAGADVLQGLFIDVADRHDITGAAGVLRVARSFAADADAGE